MPTPTSATLPRPPVAGRTVRRRVAAVGLACVLAGVAATEARAEHRAVLRIAIDPGHGGSNTGAAGHVEGVREKRVTLAVARLLRKRLERDGYTVVFTREADTFVTLAERARRANASGADLLLSLHANASPSHQQRGVETWVLASHVRDLEAQRSGASATNPGAPFGRLPSDTRDARGVPREAGLPSDTRDARGVPREAGLASDAREAGLPVLADAPSRRVDPVESMAARARVRLWALESARLARSVQARLATARDGDRGVHQAPFDVLEGLTMPAALVEMGFIDHPDEGTDLLRPETMRRIADAIADGVEDYSRGAEMAPAP